MKLSFQACLPPDFKFIPSFMQALPVPQLLTKASDQKSARSTSEAKRRASASLPCPPGALAKASPRSFEAKNKTWKLQLFKNNCFYQHKPPNLSVLGFKESTKGCPPNPQSPPGGFLRHQGRTNPSTTPLLQAISGELLHQNPRVALCKLTTSQDSHVIERGTF